MLKFLPILVAAISIDVYIYNSSWYSCLVLRIKKKCSNSLLVVCLGCFCWYFLHQNNTEPQKMSREVVEYSRVCVCVCVKVWPSAIM